MEHFAKMRNSWEEKYFIKKLNYHETAVVINSMNIEISNKFETVFDEFRFFISLNQENKTLYSKIKDYKKLNGYIKSDYSEAIIQKIFDVTHGLDISQVVQDIVKFWELVKKESEDSDTKLDKNNIGQVYQYINNAIHSCMTNPPLTHPITEDQITKTKQCITEEVYSELTPERIDLYQYIIYFSLMMSCVRLYYVHYPEIVFTEREKSLAPARLAMAPKIKVLEAQLSAAVKNEEFIKAEELKAKIRACKNLKPSCVGATPEAVKKKADTPTADTAPAAPSGDAAIAAAAIAATTKKELDKITAAAPATSQDKGSVIHGLCDNIDEDDLWDRSCLLDKFTEAECDIQSCKWYPDHELNKKDFIEEYIWHKYLNDVNKLDLTERIKIFMNFNTWYKKEKQTVEKYKKEADKAFNGYKTHQINPKYNEDTYTQHRHTRFKKPKTNCETCELVAAHDVPSKKKCKSSQQCNYIAIMSDEDREKEHYQEICCGDCKTDPDHVNSICNV